MWRIWRGRFNSYIVVAITANLFVLSLQESFNCQKGYLEVLVDSGFQCIKCSKFDTCPPGQGWSVSCNSVISKHTDIECKPCIPGESFSTIDDRMQCIPCISTTCLMNEKVSGNCTTESDTTTCTGVCKEGYCMNENKTSCQPCSLISHLGKNNTIINKTNDDGTPNEDSSMNMVIGVLVGILIAVLIIAFCILTWICSCKGCQHVINIFGGGSQSNATSSVDVESQCNMLHDSGTSGEENEKISYPNSTSNDVIIPLMPNNNHENNPDHEEGSEFAGTLPSLSGRSTPSIESKEMAQGCPGTLSVYDVENQSKCDIPQGSSDNGEEIKEQSSPSTTSDDTTSELGKIAALNAEPYLKACRKLNQDLPGKDWKTMAGRMRYSIDEVNSFSTNDSPADAVLKDWGTVAGNDLNKLIGILTSMGRDDVVGIIKEALGVSTSPNN